MRSIISVGILYLTIFAFGCRPAKFTSKEKSTLEQMFQSEVLSKHFVGFGLYDPKRKEYLYSNHADKYFTPASNTKILTLYSALNILGDRIATAKYYKTNDTIFLWGLGDPGFLNPRLPSQETDAWIFGQKDIVYNVSDYLYQDLNFGSGWAWDDYRYAYQAEKSFWPVYGNLLHVEGIPGTTQYHLTPEYLRDQIMHVPDTTDEYGSFQRMDSVIIYNDQFFDSSRLEIRVPMDMNKKLVAALLADTFGIHVTASSNPIIDFTQIQTLYSTVPVDSIYKVMMQVSDNFIAEQLILNCSAELFDTLNTSRAISWIQDSLFAYIIDPFQWVDGSGLSRYNMFTPRSIIQLLDQILEQKAMDWIKEIFPAGGVSGTIQNWYGEENEVAWLWAKTGTLRHNHCLSGYMECVSGKILIFSFMHNHFTGPSSKVKSEMQRLLRYIRLTN